MLARLPGGRAVACVAPAQEPPGHARGAHHEDGDRVESHSLETGERGPRPGGRRIGGGDDRDRG